MRTERARRRHEKMRRVGIHTICVGQKQHRGLRRLQHFGAVPIDRHKEHVVFAYVNLICANSRSKSRQKDASFAVPGDDDGAVLQLLRDHGDNTPENTRGIRSSANSEQNSKRTFRQQSKTVQQSVSGVCNRYVHRRRMFV